MACTLTTGFSLDCRDSVGGIKKVYISEFGNVSAFTATGGEITAITQVTSTNFFIYNLEKENGDFVTTENVSVENGTTFYESVLNFTMKKMVAATSEELHLLALNRLAIIIEDMNGKFWGLGFDNGADKMGGTNTAASGRLFGDMNGYTLGFTSKSNVYPYEVQSAVVSGLTTA